MVVFVKIFAIVYLGFVAGGKPEPTLSELISWDVIYLTSIVEASYGLGAHSTSLSNYTLQQQLKVGRHYTRQG